MIRNNFGHVASSTPKSSDNCSRCTILDSPRFRYSDLVPITPMPKFTEMDTPEIQKQAQRYGIKKTLGKAKLRTKLKEVYQYTHQVRSPVDAAENESSQCSKLATKKSSNKENSVASDSREGRNRVDTSRPQAQSEVCFAGNELSETPKKSKVEHRMRNGLAKTKPAHPYASNCKGNNKGWALSPSPERHDSQGFDGKAQDRMTGSTCTKEPSQSYQEEKIEDGIVVSADIDDPYVFDCSFGDVSRYSGANLSGVMNMDVANENLSASAKQAASDITSKMTPGAAEESSVRGIPRTELQHEECNEVISLLDASHETSAIESNIGCASSNSVQEHVCPGNSIRADMKSACDNVSFDDVITPAVLHIPGKIGEAAFGGKLSPHPNDGITSYLTETGLASCNAERISGLSPRLLRAQGSDCGTGSDSFSLQDADADMPCEDPPHKKCTEVISLLDSSAENSKLETSVEPCQSSTASPVKNEHMPTNCADRLVIPTPDYAKRLSTGSCMNKTYESVDMFDALPRRSTTPKVDPLQRNSAHLTFDAPRLTSVSTVDYDLCSLKYDAADLSGCEGHQERTLGESGCCGSSAIELTQADLSLESKSSGHKYSPVKKCEGDDGCFVNSPGSVKAVDISEGAKSDYDTLNAAEPAILQSTDSDPLDDECSSQEDGGSDREELHRSLFISYHQDPTSSSSEDEEECKSLMQRLLEKRNKEKDVGRKRTATDTISNDSHLCGKNLDSTKISESSIGVNVRLTTDSPAKKQRKVEFFNSEPKKSDSKTSEKTEKAKKSTKSKKPKLDEYELEKQMCKAIRSDSALYLSVLQYKPIYLSHFKRLMEENDLKVKASDLLDFLDNKGITFSTADENKHKGPRVRKKKVAK